MISILVNARKDSKFLAKFILAYVMHTKNFDEVELIVFTPDGEWNKELFEYFKDYIRVISDTTEIGRGGSHIHYLEAAKHAKGDWLWYMCDDQYLYDGYDKYLVEYIQAQNLDPNKVNVVVPACENLGRVTHIISKKTFEIMGFGNHGNVDSYFNETLEGLYEIVGEKFKNKIPYTPPQVVMIDLGINKNLMTTKNRDDFNEKQQIKLFKSKKMKKLIKKDAERLSSYV